MDPPCGRLEKVELCGSMSGRWTFEAWSDKMEFCDGIQRGLKDSGGFKKENGKHLQAVLCCGYLRSMIKERTKEISKSSYSGSS